MDKYQKRRKAIADRVLSHFESQTDLAKKLGYKDIRNVSPWTRGDRWFSPMACVKIEQLTSGAITRRELRPLDFDLYWPDLAPTAAA